MTTFKLKNDNSKNSLYINTLDDKHNNMMNEFKKKKDNLPKKRKKLISIKIKLENLEKMSPTMYTNEHIKERSVLKTEIENLENEIYDIEHNVSELDYYHKAGDIINDYYDIMHCNDLNLIPDDDVLTKKKIPNKKKELDTLDRLNLMKKKNTKQERKYNTQTNKKPKKFNNKNSTPITNFFKLEEDNTKDDDSLYEGQIVSSSPNKSELSTQYDKLINNRIENNKITDIKKCLTCNAEKILIQNEGNYVCMLCGESEPVIIDTEKLNYKECNSELKTCYPYKRINHLNEWLSQFQAKESIDIPDEIYNKIIDELRKLKIYNLKNISLTRLKKILKKLGLSSYYEHITYIYSKLSGYPPPTISRDTEEKIRLMFRQIQLPFDKHCPENRTNFLSYSFVLHKFFELLGYDDIAKLFQLLKNDEKLRNQDEIWKKICYELNWQYIPSVRKNI